MLQAVYEGSLSDQEAEYQEHETTRDYLWNTAGTAVWGMVFPVLSIVATQLAGAEGAGMFAMAFVTGTLLMIAAGYGVRTHQVSDLDEDASFASYQVNRWLTGIAAFVIGLLYCTLRDYDAAMMAISLGVYVYKVVDGVADVYEGRLQQADKLYLAGISQTIRSGLAIVSFSLLLLVTRDLGVASIAMAVVTVASLVLVTIPLALLETERSAPIRLNEVTALFRQCLPLAAALLLFNLIESMPKFVMEGTLAYENQLYFNALYFPAHAILLTSGFIYKPMLLKMANAWADPAKRKKFDLIIVVMFVIIVGITVVVAGAMSWFGLAIMSFLYGIDFEQYRGLCFVMLAAGGVTAGIEFLYQVITVLRRQRAVTKLYLITFGFSLFVPVLLVNFTGLPGAVIGYLIVMCILLVLLVSEYASIRMDLHRKLTGKAAPDAEMPRAARTAAMAPVQVAGAGEQAAAGVVPQATVAPMQAQAMAGGAVPQAAGAPMRAAAAQQATAAQVQRAAAQRAVAPISWTAGGTVGIVQPEPEAPEPAGEEGEDDNG